MHLLLLAGPGVGHANPMSLLARRYTEVDRDVEITLILPWVSTVGVLEEKVDLPQHSRIAVRTLEANGVTLVLELMNILIEQSKNLVEFLSTCHKTNFEGANTIFSLKAKNAVTRTDPINGVIYDMFSAPGLDLAEALGIKAAFFSPSPLTFLYLNRTTDPLKPITTDFYIPSLGTLPAVDYPECRGADRLDYLLAVSAGRKSPSLSMVLANDIAEFYTPELPLEIARVLQGDGAHPQKLMNVGPLIQTLGEAQWSDEAPQKSFLDKHPKGSVLFVSFGSWGALCDHDLAELAIALENCQRPVLWVHRRKVKTPDTPPHRAEVMNKPFCAVDPQGLPLGFRERTRERIMCVDWANQSQVLAHPSVGAFMSHCGWNSLVEALYLGKGLPIICAPIGAEQAMNSRWIVSNGAGQRIWRNPIDDFLSAEAVTRQINFVFTDTTIRESALNLSMKSRLAANIHSGVELKKSLKEFGNGRIV